MTAPATRGTGVPFTTRHPVPDPTNGSGFVSDLLAPASIRLRTAVRRGIPVGFTLLQPRSSYLLRLTARLPRRRGRAAARKRTVRLGRLAAPNQAAGPVSTRLRLSKSGRKALRRMPRRLATTLRLKVSGDGGLSQTVTRPLTLRR